MAADLQLRSPRLGDQGRGWEQQLCALHDRYRQFGRALVLRTYPQFRHLATLGGGRFQGVYTGKGPPDFTGFLEGGGWFLADAKEFRDDRWPFSDLRPQQAEDFDVALRLGGQAYLLVRSVEIGQGFLLPWRSLARPWWAWRRGVLPAASLSLEDLRLGSVYQERSPRFDYLDALAADIRGSQP